MTVLSFSDAVRGGTFGAGVPESAEFCDGPGPGMALEQNSLHAADYDRAGHTENGATKLSQRHLT